MTLVHAAWVHGHGMEIEFPERLVRERRAGFFWSVEGRAGTENWIHCAVPTPVISRGQRLQAGRVLLRYRVAGGASIHAVHVYDGERKIADINNLSNALAGWGMEAHEVPGRPEVFWGVGISIGVRFPRAAGRIELAAAGCDFMGQATSAVVAVRGA